MLSVDFDLKAGVNKVGICYLSKEKRIIQFAEFEDNLYFSNLESLVIQINNEGGDEEIVLEALVNMPNIDTHSTRIHEIFNQCNVNIIVANRNDFISKDVKTYLDALLSNNLIQHDALFSMDIALWAFNASVNYQQLYSKSEYHGEFSLLFYKMNDYVRLDVAAMKALSILPQNSGSTSMNLNYEVSSILEIVDCSKTSVGKRLIKRWIKQPIRDEVEINRRLDIVEFFVNETESRNTVHTEHLRNFPDIERLYLQFYKVKNNLPNRASLVDWVKIYNLITNLQTLADYLDSLTLNNDHPVESNYTVTIKSIIEDFENLKAMIEESVDINEVSKGDYIINPDYSDRLKELYTDIKSKHEEIKSYADKLSKDFEEIWVDNGVLKSSSDSNKQITIVENDSDKFLLRISKKVGDVAFRNSEENFDIKTSQKGYITFTSKKLKKIVEEFKEIQEEYRIEQDALVTKVLEIVSSYFPVIERASIVISELDALVAFAVASTSSTKSFWRPEISSKINKISLLDSRHLLIEKLSPSQCISNDWNMTRDISNLQIITGPNMGGKSTYIRQIGIIVLLAHWGCFVPWSKAEIPIIDAIIARVGASDHQLKGISTFMAEMIEVSCMLKTATQDSLVLVDELGRGTSTNEGFGLAWAISEYWATEINWFTFFATHFHELTSIENEVKNAKNYHATVHAEEGKLTMLYKIKEGFIDRSYGIHVAEMLQFPQEIIDEAKFISKQLEDFENAGYKASDIKC